MLEASINKKLRRSRMTSLG